MPTLASRTTTTLKPSSQVSRWFALVGWVLIGTSLSSLLFASVPVRMLDPAWQLRLISAILASTTSLLLGSLLICSAPLLSDKDPRLNQRSKQLRKVVGWFAVVLLLIIPFQFYAGYRANKKVQEGESQSIQLIKKILQGVTASEDEAGLRSFLATLPSPPPVPARFDAPFPVIRQRLLTNFGNQLNAANYQAGRLRSQRMEQFIGEATRNSVQAILMAVAFSGIADRSSPLLGLLQRLGLFKKKE